MGKLHSKLSKEEIVCCGMGKEGLCACLVLLPFAIYTPASGFGVFCCISSYMRQRTIQQYNVEEEPICCIGTALNPVCDFVFYGVNYPCSLFQVLMSVEQWESESTTKNSVNTHLVVPSLSSPTTSQPK